jgi:hypothetical protein
VGTIFEDACAAASNSIDMVYADAEGWSYQPYAATSGDVNARSTPDSSRAVLTVTGVYIDPYARAFSSQVRHQGVTPEKPGHASSRPQLDLDVTQLPYPVRSGDRVTRIKTGQVFKIAEGKFPSGGPRFQLDLNEITPAAAS